MTKYIGFVTIIAGLGALALAAAILQYGDGVGRGTALAALCAAALVVIWYFGLFRDWYRYKDSFRTIDKLAHAAVAGWLLFAALRLGVSDLRAVVIIFAAGVLFEVLTKLPSPRTKSRLYQPALNDIWHRSWRDVVANSAGLLVTLVLLAIVP